MPSPEEVGAMLRWLGEVPLPYSFPVCRIGGGYIRDRFFKDDEGPLVFFSMEALQRYLTKVRYCLVSVHHGTFDKYFC